MCFSANASFGVSAALMAGGIASLSSVRQRRLIPFASIPLVFSVQQFSEGVLWLSQNASEYSGYRDPAAYTFIIFAQVIWPTWIPFSMWVMEPGMVRKKILAGIFTTGILVSLTLAYCITQYPVTATVNSHHILYNLEFPFRNFRSVSFLYLVPTVLAPLVSSAKRMRLIGITLFASYLASAFIFGDFLISVWCFFAAIISTTIYFLVLENQKIGVVAPETGVH